MFIDANGSDREIYYDWRTRVSAAYKTLPNISL